MPELPVIRVYGSLRTAHLERFQRMVPAVVLYTGTRRDFDPRLADPDNPPRASSRRAVLRQLFGGRHRVVELNEPTMVDRWGFLLLQVAAVRLRGRLLRRPAEIVAYCIGRADPALEVRERWGLPRPVGRLLARAVMTLLVLGTDRLAFGTDASLDLYRELVGRRLVDRRARLFEAVPCRCPCVPADGRHRQPGDRALFVGSFVERKGVAELMAAWDEIRHRRPEATLTILGSGPLEEQVRSWASARPEVAVRIDPPRDDIHGELRRRGVLILLSRPWGPWREQIGLPILEGLAHGCEVVATSETGLARWLRSHGHAVVAPDAAPGVVSDAVLAAFDRLAQRDGSLADLPQEDQRVAADRWMTSAAS